MAKRIIITKKRVHGKGIKYLNVCPLSNKETTYTVGNPKTCGSQEIVPAEDGGIPGIKIHKVCKYFQGHVIDKGGFLCVNCSKKNLTHDWNGGILK